MSLYHIRFVTLSIFLPVVLFFKVLKTGLFLQKSNLTLKIYCLKIHIPLKIYAHFICFGICTEKKAQISKNYIPMDSPVHFVIMQ